VTCRAAPAAVEIDGVFLRRKPVKERAFGISSQLLWCACDRRTRSIVSACITHTPLDVRHPTTKHKIGYRVTVVESEAFELSLGLNTDEEWDTLLAAVDAEMALAIALLLLGRGQSHHDASWVLSLTRHLVTR
jgi:hypothetical protein